MAFGVILKDSLKLFWKQILGILYQTLKQLEDFDGVHQASYNVLKVICFPYFQVDGTFKGSLKENIDFSDIFYGPIVTTNHFSVVLCLSCSTHCHRAEIHFVLMK